MELLTNIVGIAVVFFLLDFCIRVVFKAIRFGVFAVAIRHGWRPKIYHKDLANKAVQEAIKMAQEQEQIDDNQRDVLERYGEWLIEAYSVNFAKGQ